MTSGQKGRSKKRKAKRAVKPGRPPLAAHRGFVPLLGLWGMALGGALVMVLPPALLASSLEGTMIGVLFAEWGTLAQVLLAVIAGLVVGGTLGTFAVMLHGRARRQSGTTSMVARAMREVTPINPARDLGSRRLDDPVEPMPFTTPAWRDADLADAPEPACAPAPEPVLPSTPRELDLAEFAMLPGRNAVWVEEPAPVPQTATAAPEPAPEPAPVAPIRAAAPRVAAPVPTAPGTAALARLRAVPTEKLSLPQMVERFAGALHEHRTAPPARSLGAADLAAREAMLAEALKGLAALSGNDRPQADRPVGGQPLRAALAQLQPLAERSRGAA
jgi:hypothetical protein